MVDLTEEDIIRRNRVLGAARRVLEQATETIDSLIVMKEPYSMVDKNDLLKLFEIADTLSAYSNALKSFRLIYSKENNLTKKFTYTSRRHVEDSVNIVSYVMLESRKASTHFVVNLNYIKNLSDSNAEYFITRIYRKAMNRVQSVPEAADKVIKTADDATYATDQLTKPYNIADKKDLNNLENYCSSLVTFFENVDDFEETYNGKSKFTQANHLRDINMVTSIKLDLLDKLEKISDSNNGGSYFFFNLSYGLKINMKLRNYFSIR